MSARNRINAPPPPPHKRVIRDRILRNRTIDALQLLIIVALFVGLAYRAGWLDWVIER